MKFWGAYAAKAGIAMLVLAVLSACSSQLAATRPAPQPSARPPSPPPPTPPPVDLAGRWKLTAASGGVCFMNFGAATGAAQGTIAPEGGCPDNFFTSRKWTFEHGSLVMRSYKGEPLARLTFVGGHFEGRETNGTALTLAR